MKELGVKTLIYTDIGRDGLMGGVNVQATVQLSQVTGLEVIASGGVAALEDIRRCYAGPNTGWWALLPGEPLRWQHQYGRSLSTHHRRLKTTRPYFPRRVKRFCEACGRFFGQ